MLNSFISGVNYNLSFIYQIGSRRFIMLSPEYNRRKEPLETLEPDALLSQIHPDDHRYVRQVVNDLVNGLFKGNAEFRLLEGEQTAWVRLTPLVFSWDGETYILGNVTDVSSEVNNTEFVRRYANKKNSILNMLAHDLRGPLNIANTIALALDKKVGSASAAAMTKSISGILAQSIAMINDLIDRELLETVEVELDMRRIDIVKKIGEYVEECRISEEAAQRVFQFEHLDKVIYLHVDEAKFMQIMNNLMSNALKFTRPGGTISIQIEDHTSTVLFRFSDNGIGVPAELQNRLFDKFTKARRKGLNGEPTIGLGLSIVKTIVEWHKGKIWCESTEQEGTTFIFEIPKGSQS
jgi:two-component system sensor histidine kinase VicK